MKSAIREYKYSWFVVFCVAAIVAILACNLWLLCWGHCVINDFLRIPPIGLALIVANLLAGLIFVVIKRRNKTKLSGSLCSSCHSSLRDTWLFCPNCGEEQVK